MARDPVQERICTIIGETGKKGTAQYSRSTIYNIFLGRFVENLSKDNFKAKVKSSKDLRKILLADCLASMLSQPSEDYSKYSIDQLIGLAMENAGNACITPQSQPAAAPKYNFPSFSQQVMADMYAKLLDNSRGLVLNSASVPDLKAVVVLDELSRKFGPGFCQAFEEIDAPQQRLLEELAAGNVMKSIGSGLEGIQAEAGRIGKSLNEYKGSSIGELAELKSSADKLARQYKAIAQNPAVRLLVLGKEADLPNCQRQAIISLLKGRDLAKELAMLESGISSLKKSLDDRVNAVHRAQADNLFSIRGQYSSRAWPVAEAGALSLLEAQLRKIEDYKSLFSRDEAQAYGTLLKNISQHITLLGKLGEASGYISQKTKALAELKQGSLPAGTALAVLKDACEVYLKFEGIISNEHFAELSGNGGFKAYESLLRQKLGSYAAFVNQQTDSFIAGHGPASLYSQKTYSNCGLGTARSAAELLSKAKFADAGRYAASLNSLAEVLEMEDRLRCLLERPSSIVAEPESAKKLGALLREAREEARKQPAAGYSKGYQQWFSEHLDYLGSWAGKILDSYLNEVEEGVRGISKKFHRTNPDKYWKLEKIKSQLVSLRNACEVLEDVKQSY